MKMEEQYQDSLVSKELNNYYIELERKRQIGSSVNTGGAYLTLTQ